MSGAEPLSPDRLARYQFAARDVAGLRVLDVGAAEAAGALVLLDAGAREVVAVERDDATVRRVRRRSRVRGLALRTGDAETLEGVVGPFDRVCAFDLLEQLARPARFVAAAARLLTPTGRLLVSCSDPRSPLDRWMIEQGGGDPEAFWTAAELQALLSPRFAEVELRAQVLSHGAVQRREAAELVAARLAPASSRAGGAPAGAEHLSGAALLRALAASPQAALRRLAAPGAADFPVVSAALAPHLGEPHAIVAVAGPPRAAAPRARGPARTARRG